MGRKEGEKAQYQRQAPNVGLANIQAKQAMESSPQLQKILADYASGNLGYQQALQASQAFRPDTSSADKSIADIQQQMAAREQESRKIWASFDLNQDHQYLQLQDQLAQAQVNKKALGGQSMADYLATSSATGNRFASDQVMQDPLYRGILHGDNNLRDQAVSQYDLASSNLAADREALLGRDQSYGLTPQDLAAYGQASNQIARNTAAQGNNLAQMLASRGLASGGSGAAGVLYSGLAGNQNEQLANAQMQIAQNRINTAMQLAQSRAQMSLQQQAQAGNLGLGLGNLGMNAQGQYYKQNLAGAAQRSGDQQAAAQLAMAAAAQNQNMANEFFSQQQATKSPGFLEGIGNAITSAPANIINAGTGALGSSLGKKAGYSIFGK